jgi:hypothetical protein
MNHLRSQSGNQKRYYVLVGIPIAVATLIFGAVYVMFLLMDRSALTSLPGDRLTVANLHHEAQSIIGNSAKGPLYDYPEHFDHVLISQSAILELSGPRVDYVQAASCYEYSRNYAPSDAHKIGDRLTEAGYQPDFANAPMEFLQSLDNLAPGNSARLVMSKGRYEVAFIVGEPNTRHGILFPGKSGSRVCFSEHDLKF